MYFFSDFNLGDWKEKYGKGAVDESQKWFADNFDTNAYSMWFGVHKYPEDNDNENKALTYIEGVKNRIEGLRKHVHAMFLINRINNNFVITCVVISKGTTLVFEVRIFFNIHITIAIAFILRALFSFTVRG